MYAGQIPTEKTSRKTDNRRWNSSSGSDTLLSCELALIWPDLGVRNENDHIIKDDPIKLQQVTRQVIVNFTEGTLASPDRQSREF